MREAHDDKPAPRGRGDAANETGESLADGRAAGFRTFLLSDIRGYSAFASARGDEAAAALTDRFAALAGEVVSRYGGENIGNRGDEVLVAFESPRQAIRAAIEFEQALLDATREDPTLPMPAGVGIDIGEAVVVADGWRANAINVAARLCSIAKGGEILATPEVAHLAQAVDGVRYVPRPAVRLKGIPKPVRPVRIVAEAGDTLRGFTELGLTHAQAPPTHRRKPPLWALAAGVVVVAAAAIVGITVSGGTSVIPLGAGEVGAISTASGDVTLALHINGTPSNVAVGQDGSIWVTSTSAGTLSQINPITHAVTQIRLGSDPAAVTVAPDGSVWVANSGDGTVSRVSPQNDAVVATVHVGSGPTALVATRSAVWVANTLNGSVTRIALPSDRVTATIPVGSEPAGIAAGGGSIWVANQGDGTVYRLDQATHAPVSAPIKVGNGPVAVAFADRAAWVANSIDGTLSRIDAQSNSVTTIPVGQGPIDVVAGPGQVWVSDEYTNAVTEVDPAKLAIVRTTKTESAPLGLALHGSRLWVATGGVGATVHRGGVLYSEASAVGNGIGPGRDVTTIDVGSAYTLDLWRLLAITSDGLVGYRRTGGIAGSALVPDLAVSLPVPTGHGMTYTFRIRTGIRYSNGVSVRASDFRRGLERAFQVGGVLTQYFASLIGAARCRPRAPCDLSRGVVANDATGTVTFHLSAPDPDFLNQLALPVADAVPPGTPVHLPRGGSVPGTGPYEISRYTPSSSTTSHGVLILRRNPYFRQWSAAAQPAGFPDRIVVHTGYSPASEVAAVRQGRADFTWDPPPTRSLGGLAQSLPTQLHQDPQAWTNYVWLNVHRPPFNNVLARRAINYAVDRVALERIAPNDLPGEPTCQLLPPNFPGYVRYCPYTLSPSSSGRWLAQNLSRARMLVRESRTLNDRVTLLSFAGVDHRLERLLVSTLQSIGYSAQLKELPPSEYFGGGHFAQAEAGIDNWIADYVAPSNFLARLVECGLSTQNGGRFCDPSLDARIKSALAQQSLQPGVASQQWTAIDRAVVNDAVDVPISNSLEATFVSRRVGNYEYNPQWGVLIDQLWVR